MPSLSSPCWARLVSMGKSVCRPRHRCGKLHCPCTAQPSTFESSSLCSAPKPAVAGTVLHTGMACSGGVQESQAHAACRDGHNRPARSLRPAPGQAGRPGSPIPLREARPHAYGSLSLLMPPEALDGNWIAAGLQLYAQFGSCQPRQTDPCSEHRDRQATQLQAQLEVSLERAKPSLKATGRCQPPLACSPACARACQAQAICYCPPHAHAQTAPCGPGLPPRDGRGHGRRLPVQLVQVLARLSDSAHRIQGRASARHSAARPQHVPPAASRQFRPFRRGCALSAHGACQRWHRRPAQRRSQRPRPCRNS